MLDSVSTKECQWDPMEQIIGGLRLNNILQPKGSISWNYFGTNLHVVFVSYTIL
jgi:hypothetical protein